MKTYTQDENINRAFRRIVGLLVFSTGLLGFLYSRYWLLGTMFIGLNLLQYSFTGWCPLMKILRRAMSDTEKI